MLRVEQDKAREAAATAPEAPSGAGAARACHMSHNGTQAPTGAELAVPDSLEGLLPKPGARFPSPEMVSAAVGLFESVQRWDGTDSGFSAPAPMPWAASPWHKDNPTEEQAPHVGSRSRYGTTWAGSQRFRVTVSPGSVQVSRRDLGKEQASLERASVATRATADQRASSLNTAGLSGFATAEDSTRSKIEEWSRKSRANMVKTYAQLDYRPLFDQGGTPAMVTLTLPGEWVSVVPTAADYVKLLKVFRLRWERHWIGKNDDGKWGKLSATWKREFQRRGAPHTHFFVAVPEPSQLPEATLERMRAEVQPFIYGPVPFVPPVVSAEDRHRLAKVSEFGPDFAFRPELVPFSFPEWLSGTWADVVNHGDWWEKRKHIRAGTGVDFAEGLRASDPQRLAVYFAKHGGDGGGGKEYQNKGPAEWEGQSLGRFWGYWGLEKALGTAELTYEDWIKASRIMRKHHEAKGLKKRVRVWHQRYDRDTGEAVYRFQVTSSGVAERVPVGRWRWATRKSRRRFSGGSGFVTANNGPEFASAIARAVSL